jgi:hypothetical protein
VEEDGWVIIESSEGWTCKKRQLSLFYYAFYTGAFIEYWELDFACYFPAIFYNVN